MFDPAESDVKPIPKPTPRTRLERWMWTHRVTGQWLADQCGVDKSLISRVISGERRASEALSRRLRALTGLKKL